KAGFSEREIAELIALVGRWNARPGLDQGNGIGNSKVLTISKENHIVEIANNELNMTDISQQNLNNNVNNTIEKNEDPSVVPLKPSDPSDPSADLDNNHKNNGIEKKQDTDVAKPKNNPTHPVEASPPSPPSPQFECPFEGCGQRFGSQSELIAHMDKESADARKED
ncbi:MAG: hypothetical protein WBZ36_13525, partial [Candidatus Nitrosopolaris sp.]